MSVLNVVRGAVGAAMLVCAGIIVAAVLTVYTGPAWLNNALQSIVARCFMLLLPLGLLTALLALPGGSGWEVRLRRGMVMKLLLIPFFAVNFLYGFAGLAVFFLGGLLLTIIAAFAAWITMLATSADVIRALLLMRKEGRISADRMVIHIVLQLVYCADVVDAVVLWRNREKYLNSNAQN